jgi:hypothetical protein
VIALWLGAKAASALSWNVKSLGSLPTFRTLEPGLCLNDSAPIRL